MSWRKAVFESSRNEENFNADGTSTTLALKKKYADQTLLAVLRQVPREADPNTSLEMDVSHIILAFER
ncbi:hypothetical protein TNCV_2401921 [Trichonephila clavipes]|nr:hypothetical protein TNCV_2401921 [Trichonephila clavipes]